MSEIIETNGRLIFKEQVSTGLRVFLFAVGLLPWFAPYELLIKPGWNGFHWLMIFFGIISLGAIAVSLGFIGAAILGMDQTLTFDPHTQTITHVYETAVTPLRKKQYAFREVAKIEVLTHDWDNGPSTYSLNIMLTDKRKLLVGNFSSKDEAEQYKRKLESWAAVH